MQSKESKIVMILWISFLSVGLITIIIGIICCLFMFNYNNKTFVKGTVSKNDGNNVFIKYVVSDEEYESKLGGYSSTYIEGNSIKIYYDNDNPKKIGTVGLDMLILIAPGIGLIFTLIGGIGLIVIVKSKANGEKLKENGERINAMYSSVERNLNINVAHNNPYNIICEWNNPEDGKKYIFKSKNIWFDPQNLIKEKNITVIPVYIDMKNKKNYFVDVSEIEDSVVDLR